VVVRVPHIGQGHDLSGEPERLERAEGLEKDRALQGRVTGLTGLVIQWEVQEDRSWWPNRKGDVPGRGHAKRRDPSLLDLAGRQSDGLVADGSDRDEEHSVHGGLGEACAGLLLQEGIKVRFKIVGFPDEHTVTGNQEEIFRHYGIEGPGLATTARQLLANH